MPALRHSFTTRLLITGISAKLYYGDVTVDDILSEIARQGQELCAEGVEVAWP